MPAGTWSKLLGDVLSFFQFGGTGGPGINANGAALETRNAANAAFAVHRGATPVAANDLTTKAYVDAAVGGEGQWIRFAITNAASQDSVGLIPAGAIIMDARLDVVTPYSGGATIQIGIGTSHALFMDTTDNTATIAGLYQLVQDTSVGAGGVTLHVTVAGAPAAGAGFAMVQFAIPTV